MSKFKSYETFLVEVEGELFEIKMETASSIKKLKRAVEIIASKTEDFSDDFI